VGHFNYQHPERIRSGYYQENADAFSALVIYLSLLALKTDPELWNTPRNTPHHSGENLIFSANDFKNPGLTLLWNRLNKSPDAEVQRLTAVLENFCRQPVSAVPDLEEVLQGLRRPDPQASTPSSGQGGIKSSQTVTSGLTQPEVPDSSASLTNDKKLKDIIRKYLGGIFDPIGSSFRR
jgi:hypothetical protein